MPTDTMKTGLKITRDNFTEGLAEAYSARCKTELKAT